MPRAYTVGEIRDISERIYRIKLGAAGVKSMLKADAETDPGDNGARLRRRAACYDRTTQDYLMVLGLMDAAARPRPRKNGAAHSDDAEMAGEQGLFG